MSAENAAVTRRALLLPASIGVVLLLAGCAGGTAEAPRTATRTAAPTVTPLVTPSTVAGEITRSAFGGTGVHDGTGAMPRSGAIAVDVACAGTDGGTMAWSLVAGNGSPLGLSGVADCSGPPTTSWLGVTATTRPAEVSVRLQPASGAESGYAIVRRGTP